MKVIISADRHKIENEEIDFVRDILNEVPDGLFKNEALYKRCKRRADSLNKIKDESGSNLFPKMTATIYFNHFKELVASENLRLFNRVYKDNFASYIYHFIINKGYELPINFEELINNYSLNPDIVKVITQVKELFFDSYYKGLKEVRDLIEAEYINYYEYYLSLVKNEMEVKKRDEKHKS